MHLHIEKLFSTDPASHNRLESFGGQGVRGELTDFETMALVAVERKERLLERAKSFKEEKRKDCDTVKMDQLSNPVTEKKAGDPGFDLMAAVATVCTNETLRAHKTD